MKVPEEDEIARLREREAQLERENALLLEGAESYFREAIAVFQSRAEAAEAAVWEMSRKVNAAEARVARLEEALREIAVGYQDVLSGPDVDRIMALAHEEEA